MAEYSAFKVDASNAKTVMTAQLKVSWGPEVSLCYSFRLLLLLLATQSLHSDQPAAVGNRLCSVGDRAGIIYTHADVS
jgi:hypothetical protein